MRLAFFWRANIVYKTPRGARLLQLRSEVTQMRDICLITLARALPPTFLRWCFLVVFTDALDSAQIIPEAKVMDVIGAYEAKHNL